jgi:GNAT superfamily N-acetyltransferase
MDDRELARLEHENMIGALTSYGAHVQGGLVRREDGVALIATSLPILLFNQVLVDDDGATEEALADAVATIRARGAEFVVNLRVGADDRRIDHMARLGLSPLSATPWMPGMALHPLVASTAVLPPGHEIRRVTDAPGFDDLVRAAAAGFGGPEALMRSFLSPEALADPTVSAYVGYQGGEAVTAGIGVRTDRTIGVYNIATVPSARRRGFGAAITSRITDDAAAAGCDVAVLQASDMGYPVYERLGYRTVIEYMGYVDPSLGE